METIEKCKEEEITEKPMSKDVKPWDMINGSPRASEEIAKERLDICRSCMCLQPITEICLVCSCFMKLKTKLEDATCPLGKW
jgi:hypothetical protein